MKPYGLPRWKNIEFPDVADIQEFGLKSSAGNLPKKGGDIHSSFRSSSGKRGTRRVYKKRERLRVKRELESNYDLFVFNL